jgi:hypothetical protein
MAIVGTHCKRVLTSGGVGILALRSFCSAQAQSVTLSCGRLWSFAADAGAISDAVTRTLICAPRTAGVDVERSQRVAAVGVTVGGSEAAGLVGRVMAMAARARGLLARLRIA